MQDNGGSFQQKPIRTLGLFGILSLCVIMFLLSVLDNISSDRHLPSHTSITNDRALRGKIISKDGYTLSRSSKTYKATVFTQSINPNKQEMFVKLFSIYSGMNEENIWDLIEADKGYTVLLKKLDASTAIHLKSLAYKLRRFRVFRSVKNSRGMDILYGLDIIENGEERTFPLKDTMSPVLGYVRNKDDGKYTEVGGMKGLERRYEKHLSSGTNGFIRGKRDVSGTIIRNKKSIRKVRRDGMDIHLNIPLNLQRRVEMSLDAMRELTQAKEIIAGVMDSSTGRVLALASSQRYDPDHIGEDDVYSLNPKFGEFLYEPGSVIKPLTLAIALDHGRVEPDSWFDTSGGKLKISKKYTISDDEVFESLTATDIIVHSSNVGISKIAWRLNGKEFYDGLKGFGFASSSGLDLSRELPGKIKSAKQLNKKLDRANHAYGYGMMATFVQIWKAYNSFNNDGIAPTPQIIDFLQDSKSKKFHIKPSSHNLRTVSKKTANQIKKILKKVVSDGTGKAAIYPGLEVGGKTGTAHIVEKRRYIDKYNSSFFGFVNDDKGNKYTIGVLAIRLTKRHKHFASQSAVPTFKRIVTNMIELGYLKPNLSKIEEDKMRIQEKKREAIAQTKQRKRTREIKAQLKRERAEIRRKQKRAKALKQKKRKKRIKKKRVQKQTPYQQPIQPKKRQPKPRDTIPDMF